MMDVTRKPKVGLLLVGAERFRTLGEGTKRGTYLARKQARARQMAEDVARWADLVWPGIVFTREEMRHAIATFEVEKPDCILAIYLSWAEDFAWVRFLRDMPSIPILFAHPVASSIVLGETSDDDEFTEFLCYGGLVGTLEASGDNARFKRPMFESALGTWEEIQNRCQVFSSAARTRATLRQSTIGLLACENEAMWSTYVDPYDVFMKVGPELRFLSIAELADEIARTTDSDVDQVIAKLDATYERLSDVDESNYRASVCASLAMERLAARYDLDLLVLNDIDTVLFRQVGLRPGFWPTSDQTRTLVVPEGEIGGGIASYILKLLSGGDHVNFIEPFHIDRTNNNFAAGHAEPNDYREGKAKDTKIARDVRFARTTWKHAGAPFAWHVFSPGEKTMLHCSENNGRFKLVTTRIEALATDHILATYSHGLFRAIGQTNEELFRKLLDIGVTQHYAIVPGNYLDQIRETAKLLDFDYYEV